MIHYRDAAPDPARPIDRPGDGPKVQVFAPVLAHDPLYGPARHRDPVAALAEDLREIAATRGAVEEIDLTQRGWTAAEVVAHGPAAIARAQGREAAPAGRVPL